MGRGRTPVSTSQSADARARRVTGIDTEYRRLRPVLWRVAFDDLDRRRLAGASGAQQPKSRRDRHRSRSRGQPHGVRGPVRRPRTLTAPRLERGSRGRVRPVDPLRWWSLRYLSFLGSRLQNDSLGSSIGERPGQLESGKRCGVSAASARSVSALRDEAVHPAAHHQWLLKQKRVSRVAITHERRVANPLLQQPGIADGNDKIIDTGHDQRGNP